MNLANCPSCGRLFSRQGRTVCPKCVAGIEKEYEACVEYLKENKHCTMNDLSEGTGVHTRQIKEFIREGRISMEGSPNMSYPCDSCGQPIREGQLCDSCRGKLQRDMKNAQSQAAPPAPNSAQGSSAGGTYQIGNRLKDR